MFSSSVSFTTFFLAPSPYDCNFESGICSWKHDTTGNMQWTRWQHGTPSLLTGPKYDHTTKSSKCVNVIKVMIKLVPTEGGGR